MRESCKWEFELACELQVSETPQMYHELRRERGREEGREGGRKGGRERERVRVGGRKEKESSFDAAGR